MVDARCCSKKELEVFASQALARYKTGTVRHLRDSFVDDFRHWDGSHFRHLQKETAEGLRDVLHDNGVNVVLVSRNNAATNLAQYTHRVWVLDQIPKKALKRDKDQGDEEDKKDSRKQERTAG